MTLLLTDGLSTFDVVLCAIGEEKLGADGGYGWQVCCCGNVCSSQYCERE